MMPELAGGKPKRSAVDGEEGVQETEEAIQINAVGQKVSTAARGKHDLLVKAKTGTGKTIVRSMSVPERSVLITGILGPSDRIQAESTGRDHEELGRPIRRWSKEKGNRQEFCWSRHHLPHPRIGYANRQRSHQSLYMAQRT
jgi:hypothetical protein